MAKQPVIKVDDIKDIAEIMTKSEISEVENSFVRQAVKDKESREVVKPTTLVVEEIQVNDRTANKDEKEEGR